MTAYPLEFIDALASRDPKIREDAARRIIQLRIDAIEAVEQEIKNADPYRRGKLRTKKRALQNNINAWRAYIDDQCPRYAPS
jgi:hypothetical protein